MSPRPSEVAVVPGRACGCPASLGQGVRGTEWGRAPYLETVFSGLATHVKDIQGTGPLHAVNRSVDMQKDKPVCQSTESSKHSKDTPPRPLSPCGRPWSHPSWSMGLYLTGAGVSVQFLTWTPQVYPYVNPSREKAVSLCLSQRHTV